MSIKSILLIGDSFGTERRQGTDVEVPADKTWPQQVARQLAGREVICDFLGFRRLVECPSLISKSGPCDLVLVQAGIVDIYPRPFPHSFSKSMRFGCRLARRLVRPWRREWINYVYRTTWSSVEEVRSALSVIGCEQLTARVGFVTVPPLTDQDARQTPGAQESIMHFNDLLREEVKRRKNWFLVDLHAESIAYGYTRLISPHDSHLGQHGNDWLAQLVLDNRGGIGTARSLSCAPALRVA